MESLFKGYYQPTPEHFKKLWEEGTFVFDTNVLLGLYRYKKESRDEVLNVIKKIEDRIWIPYQVGLEFHRNRLTVLGEQNSSLSTIKNSIRESISSIEKKCKNLDLDKRHSEIETATFIERFRELSESVINELDEVKAKKLTNNIDQDVVLTELTTLFSISKGSLGSPPKDQKVLEDIYKDGEFRAKNKIPPSFEDILKAQKLKRTRVVKSIMLLKDYTIRKVLVILSFGSRLLSSLVQMKRKKSFSLLMTRKKTGCES